MSPVAALDRAMAFASAAEAAGFTSGWVYDHFIGWPDPAIGPVFEAWSLLSILTGRTDRLRLGTMVSCVGYRNPALLAKMAATLDVASGGRLDVGVGAGWYEPEYRAYGFPFDRAADRVGRLEESIDLMRRLWTGDQVTFRGKYYEAVDAFCRPRPLQRPNPPIWVGGGGEQRTLLVVARQADAWNLSSASVDEFKAKSSVLDARCLQIGREPGEIRRSVEQDCVVLESEGELDSVIRKYRHRSGQKASEVMARHLVGTPSTIASRVHSYIEAGVEDFALWFSDAPATVMLERFAEEVMDDVRAS